MKVNIKNDDNEMVVEISGNLTFSDTNSFVEVLGQVKKFTGSTCGVDLSHLDHIDSSGLRMLLLIHDVCHENRTDLHFIRPHGQVKEVLLHSRFDTIVRIEG